MLAPLFILALIPTTLGISSLYRRARRRARIRRRILAGV